MLQPARTKYRKQMKGRHKGKAYAGVISPSATTASRCSSPGGYCRQSRRAASP